LGGEGQGLHELVKKHCDLLVRIPMAGAISSLNVSVAAGIVLFEWRRRHSVEASRSIFSLKNEPEGGAKRSPGSFRS
jgi:tRNA C32,U32 (ribose-2'-O)-methylase TrmJ